MIEEIIIPGDPEAVFTCITAVSRPDSSHAWARAANHIIHFKDLDYFIRIEAAAICARVAGLALPLGRPPQRAPVRWGWGKGWPGQGARSQRGDG
jgi:hypothetical protein